MLFCENFVLKYEKKITRSTLLTALFTGRILLSLFHYGIIITNCITNADYKINDVVLPWQR